AYELLGGGEPSLGILVEYQKQTTKIDRGLLSATVNFAPRVPRCDGEVMVSFIGAGNYAVRMLAPAFKAAGARFRSVASSGGLSAAQLARKYGFAEATTDVSNILRNEEVDAVVISTRHDSHAALVLEAIKAGKHVFVEKPLCLTHAELEAVEEAYLAEA